MGATWHARPRGRATRARAAPTWRIVQIYLFILYIIRGFQPPVYRGGIRPLNPSGIINPTNSTNFFPCGTKVPHIVLNAGHVERYEASDRDRSAPIEWTRGPRIKIKTT